MFFGRIDVYWPDGPIESYRVNKATVAVGRSTGNDIVLDTTAVSRYHITLTFQDQQVLLEDLDSVNGTYVDGQPLTAHDARVLRGGEEIQIGDIRLIFHPPAEITQLSSAGDTTQRVQLTQATYRVELDGPDMPVTPGAHVQAVLKLENTNDRTDHFTVEVDGLPKGWARLDRGEMEVTSREQAHVVISFKPLRRSETLPGEHRFTVRVRSRLQPEEPVELPMVLHVLPFSGFGMALGTPRIEDGADRFKLYLHNQGNAPLPLLLQSTDPARQLRFQLPQSRVQLGPGERQTVVGRIEPRQRRLFGAPRELEFVLVARAQDASGFLATVPGTYVERGLLPGWMPVLAVPVLIIALLALLAGLLFLVGGDDSDDEPTPPPVITAFTVTQPLLILGDSTEVSWDVTGADSVEIVAENGGVQQRYTTALADSAMPLTFDQTGLYTLTLEARRGDGLVTANAAVEVRPVVDLALDVLDADVLQRNVQHDVRITWSVSGAREFDGGYDIWLESSDRVGQLLASPLTLSGVQTLQIALQDAQSEWLVTLYARGNDDVMANVTQKLTVAAPHCDLVATSPVVVYSGPGETYPVLTNTAEIAASISPTGRDASGAWLQIVVSAEPAQMGWVPRESFMCTGFDSDRLLVVEEVSPPPPGTSPPDGAESDGAESGENVPLIPTATPLATVEE